MVALMIVVTRLIVILSVVSVAIVLWWGSEISYSLQLSWERLCAKFLDVHLSEPSNLVLGRVEVRRENLRSALCVVLHCAWCLCCFFFLCGGSFVFVGKKNQKKKKKKCWPLRSVDGNLHIGLFSTEVIEAGEEITFDYNFERFGFEAQKCKLICEFEKSKS